MNERVERSTPEDNVPDLPPNQIRTVADAQIRPLLPPLLLALAALYGIYAAAAAALAGISPFLQVMWVATALVFAATGLWLRYHLLALDWASPLLGIVSLVVLAESLLLLAVKPEPTLTVVLVLVLLGFDMAMLSTGWAVTLAVAALAGWMVIVASNPPFMPWSGMVIVIFSSAVGGLVVQTNRVRTFKRLEAQKAELRRVNAELNQRVAERTTELARSEGKYRALVNNALIGVCQTNLEGTILFANPELARMLNFDSSADLIDTNIIERYKNPQDLTRALEIIQQDKEIRNFETEFLTRDGHTRVVVLSGGRYGDLLSGMIRDITDRKRAEEALKASEDKFSSAFRSSPNAITITRIQDGTIVEVNESACQLFGYSRAELIGHTSLELGLIDTEARQQIDVTLKGKGVVRNLESHVPTRSGEKRDILLSIESLQLNGEPCAIATIIDITDRRREEEALRKSEEQYRVLFEKMDEGYCVIEMLYAPDGKALDYRFVEINPAFEKHTGLIEALGKTMRQMVPDQDEHWFEIYGNVARTGETIRFESPALAMQRYYDVFAFRIGGDGSQKVGVLFNNITERKQAEEALKASEEKFLNAFHSSPTAITITRIQDGRILEVNESACQLFGYSRAELIGHTSLELGLVDAEARQRNLDTLKEKGVVRNLESHIFTRSGEKRDMLLSIESLNMDGENCVIATLMDITERKRAEEALKASEEKFLNAFRSSPTAITITRIQDGKFLEVNESACQLFGYSRAELIGHTSLELGIIDAEARQRNIDTLKEKGMVRNLESHIFTRSGEKRDILLSIESLKMDGENCVIATLIDITERKQANEALRASEERFAKAFRSSTYPLTITRLQDGKILDTNDAFCKLVGFTHEELIGRSTLELGLINASIRQRALDEFKAKGRLRDYESVIINRAGQQLAVIASVEMIEISGEACGLQTFNDITERKRAEAELEEANRRAVIEYQALLKRLETLALRNSMAKELIEVYRALREFVEDSVPCNGIFISLYDPERQLRTAVYAGGDGEEDDVSQLPPRPINDSPASRAIQTRQPIIIDDYQAAVNKVPVVTLGLEVDPSLPQSALIIPLLIEGQAIGAFEIQSVKPAAYKLEDVTALSMAANLVALAIKNVKLFEDIQQTNIQLETKVQERTVSLTEAKQEAERANLAKSEFLSRMSHELRTPMNSILGFAQLLRMDELTPDQTGSLEHILKSGRHLLDLINEVLDIARIESGRVRLSPEPVHVAEALKQAVDLIRPLADGRGIRIEVRVPSSRDVFVTADGQRLKQVMLNLLSNAVKYNRENGDIKVTASLLLDGFLHLAVSDTGHGIPPEKMNRLFVPFERLELDPAMVEGTGLGLALSKGLVEAMGGRIGAQSVVGEGSTFWFDLKLTTQQKEEVVMAEVDDFLNASPSPNKGLVLYVEDNLSNVQLIEKILARLQDVELVSAMQGRLAMDLARQHQPGLILLDLHLPDVHGEEVLKWLKAEPETRDIPIVVMSADATQHQIERALAAGANAYLTKPIDVKEFLQVVGEMLK